MAIFMAFQSPDVEVLGLTTIFGNTTTEVSTRNALLLVCVYFQNSCLHVWINFFGNFCKTEINSCTLVDFSLRVQFILFYFPVSAYGEVYLNRLKFSMSFVLVEM